ncbi:hypothetical protein F2Q70_00022341 [Brassica cretica]|uniref:Uncharacterized protein n=1 Tax=Brassica cretica TaxID=69181 RepID=A0A8S9GQL2_BRACR|nr:hypothetical protein F2Q70_00022341 [Brassica cretica]
MPLAWDSLYTGSKPALLVRSNRGFPHLLSLVDLLDSVVLRSLRGRRRAFRVSLFDGRFLARVLTQRPFLRGSRPVDWGCEVEYFPADFSGSAGADCSSPCR